MKMNRKYYYVNKVIACVLVLAFIIMTCAEPVHAEVEQMETTPPELRCLL